MEEDLRDHEEMMTPLRKQLADLKHLGLWRVGIEMEGLLLTRPTCSSPSKY